MICWEHFGSLAISTDLFFIDSLVWQDCVKKPFEIICKTVRLILQVWSTTVVGSDMHIYLGRVYMVFWKCWTFKSLPPSLCTQKFSPVFIKSFNLFLSYADNTYRHTGTDLQTWGLGAKVFLGGPLTPNQELWLVDWLEHSC